MLEKATDGYGWTPSFPDHRDRQFVRTTPTLPGLVDFRDEDWGIYNQGNFSTSTVNAVVSAYRNIANIHSDKEIVPSRLALYSIARSLAGTPYNDGVGVRDVLKAIQKFGVIPESAYPYKATNVEGKLGAGMKRIAKKLFEFEYQSVQGTESDLCAAMAQNRTLIAGLSIYDSFLTKKAEKTGKIPLPSIKENHIAGIAAEVIAYDLSENTFTLKANWGENWGNKGYLRVPMGYLTNSNLARDFWTIKVK